MLESNTAALIVEQVLHHYPTAPLPHCPTAPQDSAACKDCTV
jgi:hypothetical protein